MAVSLVDFSPKPPYLRPIPQWHSIAWTSEIAPGNSKITEIGNRQIAVFNIKGNFHAIDNICPHRAGPLGAGGLEDQIVYCPWHGWRFDVTTGVCPDNPGKKVECFALKVENGTVWVHIA